MEEISSSDRSRFWIIFQAVLLSAFCFQDLIEEMETKAEEVNNVIDEGNQIIDDASMPEEERKVVHEKMIGLHDDWNKLAILTSGRQLMLVFRSLTPLKMKFVFDVIQLNLWHMCERVCALEG